METLMCNIGTGEHIWEKMRLETFLAKMGSGNIISTVETKGLRSRGTGEHRDWGISLGNIGTENTLGEYRDWGTKELGNIEIG